MLRNCVPGKSSVITPRLSALLSVAIAACVVLTPLRAQAQWWSARGAADFEECADLAEKAATSEDKTSQLSKCHSSFAGRRKPGGGYTYFDFMQNRNFDIAGPNPTPQEQKQIDEQYTAFLERERRNSIAAAFTAKQQQLQQASLQQGAPGPGSPAIEKAPAPVAAPTKSLARAGDIRPRMKSDTCVGHSFSCDWPRLSEGLNDLKKLFSSSPNKTKRS
jgi:hypothetical protein